MTELLEPIPGWNAARRRVLTRYAESARYAAGRLRERMGRFPDDADAMTAEADGLERYADACELAADDPNLPNPEWDPAMYQGQLPIVLDGKR